MRRAADCDGSRQTEQVVRRLRLSWEVLCNGVFVGKMSDEEAPKKVFDWMPSGHEALAGQIIPTIANIPL